jgi:arylformamidase
MGKEMETRKIYDLSVFIYPGMLMKRIDDPGVTLTQTASIENGDAYNLSRLVGSLHIGTHIDALYHFTTDGKTVDRLSLYDLVGEALVVEVSADKLRDVDLNIYNLNSESFWGTYIIQVPHPDPSPSLEPQ